MPQLTIVSSSSKVSVEAAPGTTILAALQRAGWHLPAPCGGVGICGKCRVHVTPPALAGEREGHERKLLGDDPNQRLACRCIPVGDVTVEVPNEALPPAIGGSDAKGGAIAATDVKRAVIEHRIVSLDAPSLEDQRSVARRLQDALGGRFEAGPSILRRAIPFLDGRAFSVALHTALSSPRLVALAKDTREHFYALGFDIGTTTVAGYLVAGDSGMVVAAASEPNAQGSFGADVISRITAYGSDAPLQRAIHDQLRRLSDRMCGAHGIKSEQVVDACVVGNTTMLHLLLDLDPASMSKTPFVPVFTEAIEVDPTTIGLAISEGARAYVPPGVSAYVGADIVADLISTGMHDRAGMSLLIDIGTNGEIVLGGREALFACSTAAGPAFEGASIRHGSGGIPGAVSHVSRVGEALVLNVIDDAEPASICGTGLLDLVSMLLDDGCIDETGRIDPDALPTELADWYSSRLVEEDGEPAFVFAKQIDGRELLLTQSDVRQLQLAKGAIAAGVRYLLERADVRAEQLEAVYLAGGFGTYVRPESAVRTGIVPGVPPAKITAVGNAAGAGAVRLLLDAESRHAAQVLAETIRYEELSGKARFQEFYMEEMLFPE